MKVNTGDVNAASRTKQMSNLIYKYMRPEHLPQIWCPGCGNGIIMRDVAQAIEDGGVKWDGFSDIDRQTMEQAARQRKTPFEVNSVEAYKDSTRETLLRALNDAAIPFTDIRFTYDSFKEKYGSDVFGTMQPKRILDAVASDLYSRGYQIKTGIQVRTGSAKGNGFLIHPIGEYNGSANQNELPL